MSKTTQPENLFLYRSRNLLSASPDGWYFPLVHSSFGLAFEKHYDVDINVFLSVKHAIAGPRNSDWVSTIAREILVIGVLWQACSRLIIMNLRGNQGTAVYRSSSYSCMI